MKFSLMKCLLSLLLLIVIPPSVQAKTIDPRVLKGDVLPENAIWLESLDLSHVVQSRGRTFAGRSTVEAPLGFGGEIYPHGIGTHAHSELLIDLKGAALRFMAEVAVDAGTDGRGSVSFEVWVDGEKKADSGVLCGGDPWPLMDVDLSGADRMRLVVRDGGDGEQDDHGNWGGALLLLEPAADATPESLPIPLEYPEIASGEEPEPRINGPRRVGCTPGRPFLFRVPATGRPPLAFAASGLPPGLVINGTSGIISGAVESAGTWKVLLKVRNMLGKSQRSLTIVAQPGMLALTPPMGWNSWNGFAKTVDDEIVRRTADLLIETGLAAYGYQYVNIDDDWQGTRDEEGVLHPNEKFPSMPDLAEYLHQRGLKFGIYSSVGRRTCAGRPGSYRHEAIDARTFADWGVDYLKHDWCTSSGEEPWAPYFRMRQGLDTCDRDIVFSVCQYGRAKVWEWGPKVGANLWRTTGDVIDQWDDIVRAFDQSDLAPWAGPGHWNDPDMLVVGWVGPGWQEPSHPSDLTPNEQLTHITLWCLMAAPMLIGCDLDRLDPFTLDLLTNDEVIAVNQDPLGRAGRRVANSGPVQVWARPLWDGTLAVGLFNLGWDAAPVTVHWTDLDLRGRQLVRDLWRRTDMGYFPGSYTAVVPRHGTVLLRIGFPKPPEE